MSVIGNCGSCRFFDPSERHPDCEGRCRRRSPTPIVQYLSLNPHPNDITDTALADWPLVHTDSWCGEYEAKAVAP